MQTFNVLTFRRWYKQNNFLLAHAHLFSSRYKQYRVS